MTRYELDTLMGLHRDRERLIARLRDARRQSREVRDAEQRAVASLVEERQALAAVRAALRGALHSLGVTDIPGDTVAQVRALRAVAGAWVDPDEQAARLVDAVMGVAT